MRISRKFRQLTKLTYPHGTENMLINHLPEGYKEDEWGNYYLQIGETSNMFTCHLDTACFEQEKVNHVIDGDFIKTDGTTILGADDKAGMTVLLYMIKNKIPGLYYFFIGEESGCIGSGRLSRNWGSTDFSKYIKKVISFDRRGTSSIITHQLYGRGCSDEFATDLASKLNSTNYGMNFRLDDTGIYTDSAKFIQLVPECTNISVGYYSEHTSSERQDINFLRRLCKAVCEVKWEDLVVARKTSYSSYEWFDDDDFAELEEDWSDNYYSYFKEGDDVVKMYISKDQIDAEKNIIYTWLLSTGHYHGFKRVVWNGDSLYVETNYLEYVGDRYELSELIPELKNVPVSKLKERLD